MENKVWIISLGQNILIKSMNIRQGASLGKCTTAYLILGNLERVSLLGNMAYQLSVLLMIREFSGQIQFFLSTSNGIVLSKIYDKRDILITHLFIIPFLEADNNTILRCFYFISYLFGKSTSMF